MGELSEMSLAMNTHREIKKTCTVNQGENSYEKYLEVSQPLKVLRKSKTFMRNLTKVSNKGQKRLHIKYNITSGGCNYFLQSTNLYDRVKSKLSIILLEVK